MTQDDRYDALEPTFVQPDPATWAEAPGELASPNREQAAEAARAPSRRGSSRADVAFVAGEGPHLADETARLLQTRLRAAAVVVSLLVVISFAQSFTRPERPLVGVRIVVLLIVLSSTATLHSRLTLTLRQLRVLELTVFGSLAIQMVLMISRFMVTYSNSGNAATVVGLVYLHIGLWSMLILLYGMLVPNTWRRAALVMFPAATIPYISHAILRKTTPPFGDAIAADDFGMPIPLPFLCAFAAVYGTHVITRMRREVFRARQFGQYRLTEKLGAGGMGEVYRAEHMLLKRPCAVKLIHADQENDADVLQRFEREVRVTATLTHWNTIEIYDFGLTHEGTFYYVMELLPGMSLEELVAKHGPLPPARAVHLLRQTCHALAEAHAVGFVHRDIKPANIFAAQRGGVYDVAKLLDFGLVKAAGESVGKVTETEMSGSSFSGSPLFMAPEQVTDYGKTDGRSDIYALGGVAYFLVTGKPPFRGTTVIEILMAHANSQPSPPSQHDDVPADLEAVILKCLQKSPAERYQTVQEFDDALAACSCDGHWTSTDAEQWWTDREG